LIQVLTAPIAIAVDALSYVISAALLFRMTTETPAVRTGAGRQSVWTEAREGVDIVRGNRILASMALSLSAFNFFSSMVNALLILFAIRRLGLDAAALGVVFALGSVGFPLGAAISGSVARRLGVGGAIIWGAVISDLAVLLVPLSGLVPSVALPLLIASRLIATLTGPVTAINQLSLRQGLTPDHLLGRVNATMTVMSRVLAPVGGVLAGVLAETIGLQTTVLLAAIGVQVGFVILLCSPIRTLDQTLGA
jgi:MFS family permease